MQILLLLGASSTGKSTLCHELVENYGWLTHGGDQVGDKIRQQRLPLIHKKLLEKGLIEQFSSYMSEAAVLRLATTGMLEFSDPRVMRYQFNHPSFPGLEDVLTKAGFKQPHLDRLASLIKQLGEICESIPQPNGLDMMLDDIFKETPADGQVIIDQVPPCVGDVNEVIKEFRTKIKERAKTMPDCQVAFITALAFCPPKVLSERIKLRNRHATQSGDLKNIREGLFPFLQLSQLCSTMVADADMTDRSTLSKLALLSIALQHQSPQQHGQSSDIRAVLSAGIEQYSHLAERFGLFSTETENFIVIPRTDLDCDITLDLSEAKAAQLAQDLVTKVDAFVTKPSAYNSMPTAISDEEMARSAFGRRAAK